MSIYIAYLKKLYISSYIKTYKIQCIKLVNIKISILRYTVSKIKKKNCILNVFIGYLIQLATLYFSVLHCSDCGMTALYIVFSVYSFLCIQFSLYIVLEIFTFFRYISYTQNSLPCTSFDREHYSVCKVWKDISRIFRQQSGFRSHITESHLNLTSNLNVLHIQAFSEFLPTRNKKSPTRYSILRRVCGGNSLW